MSAVTELGFLSSIDISCIEMKSMMGCFPVFKVPGKCGICLLDHLFEKLMGHCWIEIILSL